MMPLDKINCLDVDFPKGYPTAKYPLLGLLPNWVESIVYFNHLTCNIVADLIYKKYIQINTTTNTTYNYHNIPVSTCAVKKCSVPVLINTRRPSTFIMSVRPSQVGSAERTSCCTTSILILIELRTTFWIQGIVCRRQIQTLSSLQNVSWAFKCPA